MIDIKLPPLPEKRDLSPFSESHIHGYAEADMRAYAREAVGLHMQAVPDRMVLVDRGLLSIVINALRRDAEEGRQVRGEMADLLSEAQAAPKPSVTTRGHTNE